MKKLLICAKTSIRFILLVVVSAVLIVAAITLIYKPTYSVTLNGEFIGYTNDKSKLQNKINEYIKTGDGEHIAFVQIDNLPEYKLCLLKKDVTTNDDEMLSKVKSTGVAYYKYYCVTESSVEKVYVSTKEDAESIITKLKEKNSTNQDNIGYIEKFNTELAEFTEVDTAVSSLYKKPVVQYYAATGYAYTMQTINTGSKVELGISLIRPTSGTITSRFGSRGRGTHTGLDIATSSGTPIKAAAGGKVTFSGEKGSYGNLIVITHTGGIQTYYAHCSKLYATTGDTVTQGQVIAAVGSTGNSTGAHLHLEIRVDGVAQDPQNYLY